MTDAERLAELRRKVEGIPGEWPERRDRRWILAQLDALLDDLSACKAWPCDTFANGTHHPQCRRCIAGETLGRLAP